MIQYAEIALNLPFANQDTLTYEIIPNSKAEVGKRVEVEIRNRVLEGVIIEIHSMMPNYKTKPIKRIIDKNPIITTEQIELGMWMKDFYLSTLGECLYKMIPQGRRKITSKINDIGVEKDLLKLNPEQEKIFEDIKKFKGEESIHLIYGITGSGKTEVYIHLIDNLLKTTDKSAILLVPEISLTVQTLKRLELIFGDELALLHSAMKISDKFRNYVGIQNGKKRIVIGTRSAIFAPMKNLGLIILDEEHDGSYKEHSNPRYHARQIAQARAKKNLATVVLGSATPSIETFFHAKRGTIQLHRIMNRARNAQLSKIELQIKNDDKTIISEKLLFKIKQKLEKKEQIILLLNRRGHSPLIYNRDEEKFLECPNCSTNLCYHNRGSAKCHLCGFTESFSILSAKYKNGLELFGSGTQKLEEYLLETFPGVVIERLDQDSTKNKTVIIDVIQRLINRKIDILTGTQIIAKGLDAANVTLVGVINSSIGLGLPDFRASERVYSLLTQVAGRAGRSELTGEVIIETNSSNHPVIQLAKNQDYEDFFEHEILVRKDSYYPPFCRIARLVLRSKNEDKVQKAASIMKTKIDEEISKHQFERLILLGPADAPFYKIDSNYRVHMVIKTLDMQKLKLVLLEVKKLILPATVFLEIDLDPVDLV